METAIEQASNAISNEETHPLIAISAFIYEFLTIYPYQDGNGRLSRMLTTLLLLKSNYDFVQYASVEYEIEKQKKDYYKALMAGKKNRYSKKEKIDKQIIFFLNSLKNTIIKLETNYEQIKDKKSYLNERQLNALKYIGSNEPIKISDLTNALIEYTPYILKKDVKYLVDEGIIKKAKGQQQFIYQIKNEELRVTIYDHPTHSFVGDGRYNHSLFPI